MAIQSIDNATLKKWLDNGEVLLVDVREPSEHQSQCIAGAIPLPLAKITCDTLPLHDGKKLVLQCQAGGRSTKACNKLIAENSTLTVYNLEGGLRAWLDAGLPVEQKGKHCLPLDRQVQLTVRTLLIAANILGYMINPSFYFLTGLIGCGLFFAGISGFCALATLLAKMPWNQHNAATSCSAARK